MQFNLFLFFLQYFSLEQIIKTILNRQFIQIIPRFLKISYPQRNTSILDPPISHHQMSFEQQINNQKSAKYTKQYQISIN